MKRVLIICLLALLLAALVAAARPATAETGAPLGYIIGCAHINGPCTVRIVDDAYGVVCYVTPGTGQTCIKR